MSDETRDTAVIYNGRSSSSPVPSIGAHVVSMPPVIGSPSVRPSDSPAAPNLTPIITRDAGGATGQTEGGQSPSVQQYVPSAPPLPSILRPAPQASDAAPLPRLRTLPVKEFLVSKSHMIVIGLSGLSSIMYIASWGATVAHEDHKLRRRHVASILGFIFQFLLTVFVIIILRVQPQLMVLYGLQGWAIITLFLTCLGMGMNNVVVDICAAESPKDVLCSAHYAELFASLFVSIGAMLVFFSTQQRIAQLVDKGVLSGLRGRMTQL